MGPAASTPFVKRLLSFDLDELSDRELLAIGIGIVLLLSAASWMALSVLQPPVEMHLSIAGGPASGAYHPRAQRIAAVLAHDGLTVLAALAKSSCLWSGDQAGLRRPTIPAKKTG